MPTNQFADLDPRLPLARPLVNRVCPGWDVPGTVRDDPVTNFPLVFPGARAAQPLVEPKPPTPSADELRATLAVHVASMRSTNETLRAAETYEELAKAHLEGCRARLAEFDGLDSEIAEATVVALRSGDGRLIGDGHRQRVHERADARADLDAAERAFSMLNDDLGVAQAEAEKAKAAARRAALAVLALEAEQLVERHDALLAEAAELRVDLARFDRVAMGIGDVPPAVLAVLRDPRHGVDLILVTGLDAWRAKLDALLA
jgi:hypothetical protein